jgi:hypothetical protein
LKKFVFKDKQLKLGPSLSKAINKFLKIRAVIGGLEKFSFECENYEDVFDNSNIVGAHESGVVI